MQKFSRYMFIGLLTLLSNYINAYVDPKISMAVRNSNPTQLLNLLNKTKLNQEQKEGLLLLADEILKNKDAALVKASTQLNKILRYSKYIKLLSSGIVTGLGALASSQFYFEAVKHWQTSSDDLIQNRRDAAGYICLTGITGLAGFFSALYGIKTFYNICTSKGKAAKRLDAFEVKQILEKCAVD